MILIRNADLYNPQHIGLRDILVAGGQVVAIGEGLDGYLHAMRVMKEELQ